jgi:enoyl-CoA hydratase
MPRFSSTSSQGRLAISFDDGGMNLLSRQALQELRLTLPAEGFQEIVTFSSARPGLFAAGADMAEMSRFAAAAADELARLGQEVFSLIEALPSITVALIDGDCFGGALDLAMAFDLRFATPRSRFSHPGARLGIVTGYGGTSRWRRLFDRSAARKLFLGNPVVAAGEAQQLGLVDIVSENFASELDRLAALDPATTRFLKELAPRAERLGHHELDLLSSRLWQLHHSGGERGRGGE